MWSIEQIISMNKEPVNDDTPNGIYLENVSWNNFWHKDCSQPREYFLPDPFDPNYVYEPRTR